MGASLTATSLTTQLLVNRGWQINPVMVENHFERPGLVQAGSGPRLLAGRTCSSKRRIQRQCNAVANSAALGPCLEG